MRKKSLNDEAPRVLSDFLFDEITRKILTYGWKNHSIKITFTGRKILNGIEINNFKIEEETEK